MPEFFLDAAGRPPCPASTPAAHRARRASATRPTRPLSRRSSPSCATPAGMSTGRGCARSSSCCGARGCASTKPSRSTKPTSTPGAAPCSCDTAKADVAARSAWTTGPGSNGSPGSPRAWTCRSVRCCASRAARPAAAPGRTELRQAAVRAGVRCRFAPHQLRHAHAVEMAREGVPLIVMSRQLGHTNLGIASIYLQGIDSTEIIDTVSARRPRWSPSTRRFACEGERCRWSAIATVAVGRRVGSASNEQSLELSVSSSQGQSHSTHRPSQMLHVTSAVFGHRTCE
jgi:hypothetical protein